MEKENSQEFVRDVNVVPDLSVFVASDQQLKDIERFRTKVSSFSIFGIDITYSIGNFMLQLPFIGIYYLILQRESIQFYWVLA